jgi:hypothetical protein
MTNTLRKGTYTETESGNPAEVWHDEQGRWHNPDGPAYIERDPETGLIEARRYIHGELHCETGPAITLTNAAGVVLEEDYFQHNLHHREDGPARIRRWADGRLETEMWFRDGQWHRDDDEPAHTRFDEHGQVCEHRWIKNGLCTRANGPACVEYDDIGGRSKEEWYNTEGELHGPNDHHHPAVIEYRYGNLIRQAWYHRNERHRGADLPAELFWDEDGAFLKATYIMHDEIHRTNGPAIETTDPYEYHQTEEWVRDGKHDRQDGPAIICVQYDHDDDGEQKQGPVSEAWYRKGKPHTPTAHDQMRWAATQAKQGGPLWKEPEDEPEPEPVRPGGVKAAAAAVKAKDTKPKPKASARGQAR